MQWFICENMKTPNQIYIHLFCKKIIPGFISRLNLGYRSGVGKIAKGDRMPSQLGSSEEVLIATILMIQLPGMAGA
jgi:hypothetical protein